MTRILQGVLEFQRRIFAEKKELFEELGKGQKPLALFITCADSRISPDLLAQTQPGELFHLRNAGNIVPPYGIVSGGEDATIEFAVHYLRVRDIILCGHAKCGAIHGLLHPENLGTLPAVGRWVEHSRGLLQRLKPGSDDEQLQQAIELNVVTQLEHLRTHPAVKTALEARTLRMHGWVYDFERGKVTVYDPLKNQFVPLAESIRDKMLRDAGRDQGPRSEWETRA
ncbi:MAG: carbonic anhydrase [Planctomycetia bacterium]|nr:carbonic anhydrase [Planctomycetia bacterium]